MIMKTKNKPHHHGNLRETLIEAGVEILLHEGLQALSLRACAARANVSHAAPAHHFKGLAGLQAAIAARGYRGLTSRMQAQLEGASADPHARLFAICEGYLGFAQENSSMFQLMFNTGLEFGMDTDLTTNSGAAFRVLTDACAPFNPPGAGKQGSTELMIWSLVHGFANLKLSNCLGPSHAQTDRLGFVDVLPRLALRTEHGYRSG